ncbi:conserved hypothetical protein [Methylomarinovum tepidoasis]|uniref:DUF190 domain-containing protein n=1 Tax=Methylomarinovum tepidoasis TaxID=2840183 RepID=A0AAU9C028_9GAMM|nr:DUF190 domain-containing protein [Methylomarinovum sp. IN45]BCX89405.1 conserved hypothetical protein [Methylomarinovum sp. IN45]
MSQKHQLVRIYTLEGEAPIDDVLRFLHDEERVSGVTLIRAVAGYGDSGKLHTTALLSLSLQLPLIIEFFDTSERVAAVIPRLRERFELRHIVHWPVTVDAP